MGFESVRLAIALQLADTWDVGRLQRALTLDPGNPEIVRRLGLAYSYSMEPEDASRGLDYLRQAAELDTYGASYWADYGRLCDSVANLECAGQALQRAVQLAPTTPRYHWLLANHYIRSDQPDKAIEEFATLLRLDPDRYAQETFRVCLRALDDPDAIFRKVLTDNATLDLKLMYAEFLCDAGKPDSADQVWIDIAAKSAVFPFSLAAPYLARLFSLQRYEAAEKVWRDLERLGVVRRSGNEDQGNLIFNGGFEQPPLDAGFDWVYTDLPYLTVDFADSHAYQGRRCLRLDFTVPRNEESFPVYTFAPVEPGRPYRLQFYARSENIESDSGPRLRVFDPRCQSCLDVASEMTVGTTPWHPVDLDFTAGAQTKVVRIDLWRPRGRTFPNEISGSFWLDAVSLEAVAPSLPPGK
ncbi:MAG: tetratricopeptide repeat protein [Terriglobia bacterium]